MSTPPDQGQRERAATCFDRNVVVTAGAGSGKTTLLIERLLNLLLGRGVPLSGIVAMTFTEKAAAEMRERLAAQLSRALRILETGERGTNPASFSLDWVLRTVPKDVVRQRALAALDELDGASIGTIHSFCADLLRRHPEAARIDPAFIADDGSIAERLLEEEWTAFQAETLRDDAPQAAAWRVLLEEVDTSLVLDLAPSLLGRRAQAWESGEAAADERLRRRADDLLARCGQAEQLAALENAKEWARILQVRLRTFARGGVEALRDHVESGVETWPTKTRPSAGAKCADKALVEDALDDARAFTDSLLSVDARFVGAALALAGDLAARTRARLDVEGVVTFDGMLTAAREVLLDDVGARRATQERVQALLLDEFQDTDPIQYEIAFLLAEDPAHPVPPGGDPWTARLQPGRLFIVGDPKQSIYRFRGADMAAYNRAVDALEGQGAVLLTLTANFRSRTEILEPINDLCRAIIQEDLPYQPRYDALEPARPDAVAGESCVELWSVRAEGNADERRLVEGRVIGERVRAWREEGRIPDYGKVVVLLRAMTAGEAYQRGLAEAGVPFVTQGGKGFFRRDEVVHAIQVLRCLAWPNDGTSILAVLRSASGGASDVELRRFAQLSGRDWSLRAHRRLSEDDARTVPNVVRTLAGLDALARRVAGLPADEAVRIALAEAPPVAGSGSGASAWQPHLLALHAASRGGAQRLANLERLVERAEDLARGEGLSLARVVERLQDELDEGAQAGESPLADESVDAVRIMSIHQAKGLEFDVVVLPDMAREKLNRKGTDLRIEARAGMLAVHLPGPRTNLAWQMLVEEDERHGVAEDRRMLYVALTRAKERLVVVNSNAAPTTKAATLQEIMRGWGHDPRRDDGGAGLHAGVQHALKTDPVMPEPGGDDLASAEELGRAVRAQDAAAAALESARRPRPRSATGLKEERDEEMAARPYARAESGVGDTGTTAADHEIGPRARVSRSLSRATGIAVHAALEAGSLEDRDGLLALGRRAARLAAAEAECDPDETARLTDELLRGLPSSEIAQRLRGARVVGKEVPFLLPSHEGQDWQGVVDLVVEMGGETWVVDWKTDRELEPSRHAAQLALYAEAVRRWRNLPRLPRTALAYVALGRWVEP